jgi:hypothetical protein
MTLQLKMAERLKLAVLKNETAALLTGAKST